VGRSSREVNAVIGGDVFGDGLLRGSGPFIQLLDGFRDQSRKGGARWFCFGIGS